MITSAEVKKYAREYGADLVGIASMDRFEGAPKQMDPRYIFPDAKAMVVLGFRVLRGCLRGIEEGTFFISYVSMGYGGINKVYAPMTLWNTCKWIEDEGYEAVPIPNEFRYTSNDSRPVAPDKPRPDVMPHLRIAAFCAGLGEIGYSKMLLTPEFGPRQRLVALLTDAPLEPDPLFEGKLCDRCMCCARACTGQAISQEKTIKVTVAGRELEWADIDYDKCARYFQGASAEHNPFIATKEDEIKFKNMKQDIWAYDGYARALEGSSGCTRACMIHLEQLGKLKNAFKNPFRKRKPWRLSGDLPDKNDKPSSEADSSEKN